jgi:hypothetical protein
MPYSQRLPVNPAAPPAQSSKVAQRLLVHARLCRQMGGARLDEAIGEQLLKLADEALREAAEILAGERLTASSGAKIINLAAGVRVST